jgi:hypothetical protein
MRTYRHNAHGRWANSRPTSSGTGRDTYPKSYAPHGYDAGKKLKGKKRHILLDTLGLLLHTIVHRAHIQDRDGGILVMATLFGMFPFLKTLFPEADIKDRNLPKRLQRSRILTLKSSNVPIGSADLWSCPNAHHRLAQSLPQIRQGMGEPQPQGARVLAPRLNPPHAQKTLQSSLKSPNRL